MGFKIRRVWCLDAIIFLAAFLLFQIELIIARVLLPEFGGSYTVWGAAVVFFQATLLLGYLYSHFVIQRFGIYRYRYVHAGLLFAALLFFPGRPLLISQAPYSVPLVLSVFWQLFLSIGPVFFVLSTTSIIFQSWLAESDLPEHANPYALFAISNLGSFAALLSYPFIFEPIFELNTQINFWRLGYVALAALHLFALKLVRVRMTGKGAITPLSGIQAREKDIWFLFGAAGVMMFLSVSNIMTYEIAPFPLFWIMPLCIYLFSYVLNFKSRPWCPAWIENKFYVTAAAAVFLFFLTNKKSIPLPLELTGHLVLLFIVSMLCQQKLYKHKPADTRHLTGYYLIMATGGFVGGILVSWIMPLVSTSMSEYLLGLCIISLASAIETKPVRINAPKIILIVVACALILWWPSFFKDKGAFWTLIILAAFILIFSRLQKNSYAFSFALCSILALSGFIDSRWAPYQSTYSLRNYYGTYRIFQEDNKKFLLHGNTIHGGQSLLSEKEQEPILYFHYSTPIGKMMTSGLLEFKHIGVLGLGTGTLAAYGQPDQDIDFFELDPEVFRIAGSRFTYLKESPARLHYIFGDGRISLSRIPDKKYDLLVIDAFSGNSLPVHLLTVEAITEYMRCVSDEGIVLFNISNRYVDLRPVLLSNANALHLNACYDFNYKTKDTPDSAPSMWFALTRSPSQFAMLTEKFQWFMFEHPGWTGGLKPWTDQYYNIFHVLKFKKLLSG